MQVILMKVKLAEIVCFATLCNLHNCLHSVLLVYTKSYEIPFR